MSTVILKQKCQKEKGKWSDKQKAKGWDVDCLKFLAYLKGVRENVK